FHVNTTDDHDDGVCTTDHCSLREAIKAANAHPNGTTPDRIVFDLPGGSVIHLNYLLPTLTDPVVIDGTTATPASDPSGPPVAMIELDGSKVKNWDGLVVNTNNSTLRGIIVHSFGKNGIVLRGDYNTVESCYVGTHGTDDVGNGEAGILVDYGTGNRIGGELAFTGNLIAGNDGPGILVKGGSATFIQGNFIGVNALGTQALPNAVGVKLYHTSQVTVGGFSSGARNLISGNTGAGLLIDGGSKNKVLGNVIGLDVNGTHALGNGEGVLLQNTRQNEIGGFTLTWMPVGNIIAGNRGPGVHIVDSEETTVHDNTIGTSVAGVRIGNQGHGVLIEGDAPSTIVGSNEIAYNQGAGVFIRSESAVGILENAIYENQVGIGEDQRGNAKVTPPRIDQVTTTTVQGSAPPGSLVQVFGDDGNQGRYFLGEAEADDAGHFEFSGKLRGTRITATATVFPQGRRPAASGPERWAMPTYNTSLFSASVPRPSPCSDPNEANDNWLDATPVHAGDVITGTICEAWDIDFFKLPVDGLPKGSTVHFHLDNPGTDLDLILFRPTYVTHDLPFSDLPTDTSPAPDVPVKSLPLQNIPLQNIPLQNIPLQNIPLQNIPLQNIPLQNIPLQNIPLQNIPLQNIPLQNIPLQNIPLQNIPLQNIPVVGYSVNPDVQDEDVSDRVVYTTGDYYLMVFGHNGAHSSRPYTLTVTVTPPPPVPPCTFHPPYQGTAGERYYSAAPDAIQTLIVVPKQRLASIYGEDKVTPMMTALREFADLPTVRGLILPVEESVYVQRAYKDWDDHFCDPERANAVAGRIKDLIYQVAQEMPNLRYVVLVGDDRALPFRRLPDLVETSNEREYAAQAFLKINTALYAAIKQGYTLTDDFYVDFYPSLYRGWPLYVPDYAVGRLVETPEEITGQLNQFKAQNGRLQLRSAALFGYDFLKDSTQQMTETLRNQGVQRAVHNDDAWDANALRQTLLAARHDLNVLDAHFTHFLLAPAAYALQGQGDLVHAREVVSATADLKGTVNVSVGCHSGLNVCDDCVTSQGAAVRADVDFAQAFAQRRAVWIGNSGFGYGDDAAVALSEELAASFIRYLGSQANMAVGDALRQAKQDYALYNMGAYGPYDRKVINEATLYGLPNYRVTVPRPRPVGNQDSVWGGRISGGSTFRSHTYTLSPRLIRVTTDSGDYFQAEDGIQALLYNPIQPRSQFEVTLNQQQYPGFVAHGVLILDGTYQDVPNFDPVITMPVTRTHRYEPQLIFPTWQPRTLVRLNHFRNDQGLREWVTVTPGQFRSERVDVSDPNHVRVIGTERIYRRLRFQVFYSTRDDFTPPIIQRVNAHRSGNQVTFSVEMAPNSRVMEVYATCATGGQLRSLKLRREGIQDVWSGVWNNAGREMTCFIQAVDYTGNVAVTGVKGTLNLPLMPYHAHVPMVKERGR
ncbi:MAG: CSLREA domain-containing protein, partial [Chloroflexi bacterium]|nr:CSLREA domain-containing protein [Chloroflexota bacterium]